MGIVRKRPVAVGLQALIWDVDGTLAETERDGHRIAFNQAFEALGLPWCWSVDHYGQLLSVTGGRERLLFDMAQRPDAPRLPADREALASALHQRKNLCYAAIVAGGGVPLRPGVRRLLQECQDRGVALALATTTSRSNVEALLRRHLGASWEGTFAACVCGEDVARKKPDPEVYRTALAQMGLPAARTLALEDSPAGVAAACAAGVPVVVTRSVYFANDDVPGAIAVGPGLDQALGWLAVGAVGDVSPDGSLAALQPWQPPAPRQPHIGLDDLSAWQRQAALR